MLAEKALYDCSSWRVLKGVVFLKHVSCWIYCLITGGCEQDLFNSWGEQELGRAGLPSCCLEAEERHSEWQEDTGEWCCEPCCSSLSCLLLTGTRKSWMRRNIPGTPLSCSCHQLPFQLHGCCPVYLRLKRTLLLWVAPGARRWRSCMSLRTTHLVLCGVLKSVNMQETEAVDVAVSSSYFTLILL